MKNKIISMACLAFVFLAIPAQSAELDLGAKLGLNLSTLYGKDVSDLIKSTNTDRKQLPGVIGGVVFQLKQNDLISIEPELLFSMKGLKIESEDLTYTLKMSYGEIAAITKFFIPLESAIKPNLYVGPALDILLLAKSKFDEESEEDVREEAKKIDFGLCGGVGTDIDIGSSIILIDLRYTIGLISTDDDNLMKNGVLSLMVGWAFKLKESE